MQRGSPDAAVVAGSVDRGANDDLLRAVLEESADPVFVKDREGRYLFYNRAAAASIGKPPAQVIGHTDAEIFDPVWALEHSRSDAEVLATGLPHTAEETVTVDGSVHWYQVTKTPYHDASGNIIGVIGISRDITERKQAEDTLRDTARRLTNAERLAHVGSWENDVVMDRVRFSDETFRILGWEPREALTFAEFRAVIHPDDLAIQAAASDRAQDQQVQYEAQYRIVRPDGEVRTVHSIGEVVRDATGQPVRAFGAVQDITQRLALEAQFRQSQKMEAVGRLAGGVAHDFNNLLTVILGFTTLVLERLDADDPRRADLEQVCGAGESAVRLTKQLLAFSRKEVVQPRPLVLELAVAAGDRLLRRLIGEDVILTIRPAATHSTVVIDPGQLEQVILNLAVNARDAMPRGGSLVITTGVTQVDGEEARAHGLTGGGSFATLSIRDSGIGMDERTRVRIFEPFFSTKEAGKGTGLGLSTVYGIVQQHGGFIAVESEPGNGSRFVVHLPRVAAAAVAETLKEPAPEDLRGNETVLLVEDSAEVRAVVRRMLRGNGYRVIEAPNATAALGLGRTLSEPIHLLLTDVVMPGMSGRELAEEFVRSRPGTRVLYMSGHTDDAILQHGVLEASVAFMAKPFSRETLGRQIRDLLDRTTE